VLESVGEMKSKTMQRSVKELRTVGIQPDFIVCRSDRPIDDVRNDKIALFCNVRKDEIISNPNLENIYELPLLFEGQKFGNKILRKFDLPSKSSNLNKWKNVVRNMNNGGKRIKVAIVGKYFDIGKYKIPDSYISVIEAIRHACANNEVRPELNWLDSKTFERDKRKTKLLRKF